MIGDGAKLPGRGVFAAAIDPSGHGVHIPVAKNNERTSGFGDTTQNRGPSFLRVL